MYDECLDSVCAITQYYIRRYNGIQVHIGVVLHAIGDILCSDRSFKKARWSLAPPDRDESSEGHTSYMGPHQGNVRTTTSKEKSNLSLPPPPPPPPPPQWSNPLRTPVLTICCIVHHWHVHKWYVTLTCCWHHLHAQGDVECSIVVGMGTVVHV